METVYFGGYYNYNLNNKISFLTTVGTTYSHASIKREINIGNQNYKFKIFIVSPKGKKFLQDYFEQKRQDNINNFRTLILEIMRSFFFPLIVSIIVAYLTAKFTK